MRSTYRMTSGSLRWVFNYTDWTPGGQDWTRAARCIQQEERARIGMFVFKRDAKASMIGRLMIRKAIHEVAAVPYTDIKLGRTDKGKPFLLNSLPLELQHFNFNVSHQGDYVVLAAETTHQVGVDVMNLDTPRSTTVEKFFHTMRRQFTDDEWQLIRHTDQEQQQLQTFYRLWCLKESYVKALGIGIGFEVKRLNFDLLTMTLPQGSTVEDTKLKVNGKPALSWRFQECLHGNHTIAVALNNVKKETSDEIDPYTCDTPQFVMLNFDQLMEKCSPLNDLDESYAEAFIAKAEDPSRLKKT